MRCPLNSPCRHRAARMVRGSHRGGVMTDTAVGNASRHDGALSPHPHLRPHRPAGRRRRDPGAGRLRRPGHPHRGPGHQGAVGHPPPLGPFKDERPRHRGRRRASTTTTSRSSASRSTCAPSGARSCWPSWCRLSNAVTENFAAGVLERLGLRLRPAARAAARHHLRLQLRLRPHRALPARSSRGGRSPRRCPGSRSPPACPTSRRPAGATRYMDHTGGYFMAIAILAALFHRRRTGEGQWVDLSCTEAGVALHGPGRARRHRQRPRPARRRARPTPTAAPCAGDGAARHLPVPRRRLWVAIACRDDDDWAGARRA